MKNWIKRKLTYFLGIDKIEETMDSEQLRLSRKLDYLEEYNRKVIAENEFILKQFNISLDVSPYENTSWAVISIQGKPEYVRFINLSNRDMRSIHSFLKQFEKTNKTVDSPFGFFR